MDLRASIANQTDVGLGITKKLLQTEGKDKNVVYSPLSIHVVLSLIAAGSKGPTQEQLLSFVKSKFAGDLNSFASELVAVIFADGSPTGGPRLSFANGIWVDKPLALKPTFKEVVETAYKAALNQVDFQTKAAEVAAGVNLWAEKETSGLIKEVLPVGSIDASTRLVFANALYFKGAWSEKFDASFTKESDFQLLDGSQVQAPFMTSKKKQFLSAYDGFKVLGLPYQQGEDKRRFSMHIYLPDAKDGLPALVEKVGSGSGFLERHLPYEQVSVSDFKLPKFKISFGFEASNLLKGLGVVLPFSGEGGLTEMVDSTVGQNLYVSSIFHKSFIEVNEEGTEAAAASAVGYSAGSAFGRSAPTSVFSSPAVSPRRSNVADPFPFFMPHQDQHQDVGATFPTLLLSPKKPTPTLSPAHSPLHSPTPRSPRFSPNGSNYDTNSLATAHPLPLPPGAAVPTQPPAAIVHQNVAPNVPVSSMKGQWQKGKLIGRGTFGSVYLATNRETGALCAMKEVDLIPDDPKSAECIKHLEQEIKVLRTLKHPNIVQYYGSEVIDDHFYIYLEYVHPGSINKYVRDHIGAMTESVVRNFTRHILYGLAYLHDTKTIHRDIKGANLLVDASGVVKLADFGMAKHLGAHSYNLSLKGSPYWMAPEVIKAVIQNDGDPNLALAVDIWSLGCTIIEMFNGRPPWSEFEGPQAMFKVLHRTPDIPEKLSAEGKEFLNLCFRRNPAERPSAKKLLDHPFVRISNDQNVSSYTRAFSLVNLMDKLNTPRDQMKQKLGRVLVGPRTSN